MDGGMSREKEMNTERQKAYLEQIYRIYEFDDGL